MSAYKAQVTRRNPPGTNYQRPVERKFYVWRDRHIRYHDRFSESHGWVEAYPWRWMCTLCDPPSYGFRSKAGAWRAIMAVSMPRHFRVRDQHHTWVAARVKNGGDVDA